MYIYIYMHTYVLFRFPFLRGRLPGREAVRPHEERQEGEGADGGALLYYYQRYVINHFCYYYHYY